MIIFRQIRMLALLLGMASVSACSSLYAYENKSPENVTVTPSAKSGSVRMDVYDVDGKCGKEYRGTVYMNGDPVKVGMPANQQRYLVFVFWETPLFGADHSTTYSEFFKPRPGQEYAIKASYADSMYDVTVRERSAHGGSWHKASGAAPATCR